MFGSPMDEFFRHLRGALSRQPACGSCMYGVFWRRCRGCLQRDRRYELPDCYMNCGMTYTAGKGSEERLRDRRLAAVPAALRQFPRSGSWRAHVASNSSRTSTEKPGRMGEPACSPGRNTPCSRYSPSDRTSTVSVPATGLAIQYSGMLASA